MKSLPTLDDLIRLVEEVPDAHPLQLLTDSVVLAGRITDLGDELVGHFVEHARSSGATWEEVGERMGVSKQAAQKRFTPRPARSGGGFFLTRLTDDARDVVRRAATHASEAGSSQIGTEHLVLGLVDDSDCVASRAITGLGASLDRIKLAAVADMESGGNAGRGHIPFSAASKKVLELALRETIRSSDRRIGTEHILLGILREGRSRGAVVLVQRGITRKAVEAWLEEM